MKSPLFVGALVLSAVAAAGALFAVVRFAQAERSAPLLCPKGMTAQGPLCCGEGQKVSAGHCIGSPTGCGAGLHTVAGRVPGCVADSVIVDYAGGPVTFSVVDWEGTTAPAPRKTSLEPFRLDATETTVDAWHRCVVAGVCTAIPGETEPGLPVTGVSPAEAERYCRFLGAHLPTTDQWLFAAASREGRRFPWGPSGLVCRRAAFGLVNGPCAQGARGPVLAGTRPDGATPEGALDLAGNVAEWTREDAASYVARGGSYRSTVAAELVSWAAEQTSKAAPHIGFRCAYGGTP